MALADALPKTILYNLNPSYNDIVATTIANFQSAELGVKSPMQFGSGWWFNDTRRGMENQLNSGRSGAVNEFCRHADRLPQRSPIPVTIIFAAFYAI